MVLLVPVGVLALVIAVLLLIAWIFDVWVPVLIAIPGVLLVTELIWRNWWGDRWLRERFGDRDAKSS